MAMYITAIPVHTSKGRNVSLTSFWPVRYSSKIPITPTRLVSLTIPTKSLPQDGTATRTAWGSVIEPNARTRPMPSESAASR